jgi:hypothetical protein
MTGPARATPLAALSLLLAAAGAHAQLAASTTTLGTVTLGDDPDRRVEIRATYEEVTGPVRDGWRRTLTRLAFHGPSGRLLAQETFESRFAAGQGFATEWSAGPADEVRGRDRRFLLVALGSAPSAPESGTTLVVYGFDRHGRFRRLGAPLAEAGVAVTNARDPRSNAIVLREGVYLDVAGWTGAFRLIVPWRYHEAHEAFEPASLCGRVEAEPRVPGPGSVTLHRTTGTVANDLRWMRPGKTVAVGPVSKLAFQEGCRRPPDTPGGEVTTWIRVTIDGEEGWVQAPGPDAERLGLPTAG